MKTASPVLIGWLLLAAAAAQAQFICTTNADGLTVTITGYSGTGGAVAIPSAINGLAVTGIGDYVLSGFGIYSITIPASVTNIEADSFGECTGLDSINVDAENPYFSSQYGVLFNKTQTVLIQCPVGVPSYTYTIPGTVTSIGPEAFSGNIWLHNVIIPASVTNIGYGAFDSCPSLSIVNLFNGLTTIGDYAFRQDAIGFVTLPPSVTSVGTGAFENCLSVSRLAIPAGVTNIGTAAFAGFWWSTITVDPQNSLYSGTNGALFDKSQKTLVQCVQAIGCPIPNGVTSIGDYAFWHCIHMTGTTIPSTVTNIGANAFADCTNLTSVTIPAGVTSIGEEAFALCASLKAITVDAQNSCYSSTNGVLFDKSQTTLLQYPGGAVGSYTIPASVTSIADGAFLGCLVLTNVTIPASVTNIGTNAFYLCSGLAAITVDASNALYSSLNGVLFDKNQTTLIHYPGGIVGGYTIPAEVTNILDDAFDAPYSYDPMTNLTSVIIPGSVASIGANTFQYHTGLTNVTIADGVTSIASNAFDYCLGLTSVTIPGSVTSIANFAFESCENLTSVFFTGDAPPVPSSAFDYDNATVYYLPGATGWSTNFAGLPAVLWNPVIQTGDGSFGVQTNQFGFNVTGATNIPVLVEACDDLSCGVWSPLQAVALTNGSFYFSEPVQTNGAGRYYRLGSP